MARRLPVGAGRGLEGKGEGRGGEGMSGVDGFDKTRIMVEKVFKQVHSKYKAYMNVCTPGLCKIVSGNTNKSTLAPPNDRGAAVGTNISLVLCVCVCGGRRRREGVG